MINNKTPVIHRVNKPRKRRNTFVNLEKIDNAKP